MHFTTFPCWTVLGWCQINHIRSKTSFCLKAQAYRGLSNTISSLTLSECCLLSVSDPCQPSLTSLCVPLKPQYSYDLKIHVQWIDPASGGYRLWHGSANTVHKILWT